MTPGHTKKYRAFAKEVGLSTDILGAFWHQARLLTDKTLGSYKTDEKYWAHAWSTFTAIVDKLPAVIEHRKLSNK